MQSEPPTTGAGRRFSLARRIARTWRYACRVGWLTKIPWGHLVYDANLRGDYVTLAEKKNRRSWRRVLDVSTISLEELIDLKHSVCPDFIIRLDDEKVPVPYYQEQAIARNIPLVAGIGASQIDRNSISDLDAKRIEIKVDSASYVTAIKNVAKAISQNGYDSRTPPWPGSIYFEDISSETAFGLVEIIVKTALENGGLEPSIWSGPSGC